MNKNFHLAQIKVFRLLVRSTRERSLECLKSVRGGAGGGNSSVVQALLEGVREQWTISSCAWESRIVPQRRSPQLPSEVSFSEYLNV